MRCQTILKLAVGFTIGGLTCFLLLALLGNGFSLIDRVLMFSGGFFEVLLAFFTFEAYLDRRTGLVAIEVNNDQKMESMD